MITILDRLNLRPQERRFVVVVVAVFFLVINFLVIWPHYGDWGKAQDALDKSRRTLATYQRETDSKKIAEYQAKLKELEGEGTTVSPMDQAFELPKAIQKYALLTGVNVIDSHPGNVMASTNLYFAERAHNITVVAEEKQLLDFLLSIGSSNSLVRVRTMTLGPDQAGTHLKASITLIASFQTNRATVAKATEAPAAAKPAKPVARTNTLVPTIRVNTNKPTVQPKMLTPPPAAPTVPAKRPSETPKKS